MTATVGTCIIANTLRRQQQHSFKKLNLQLLYQTSHIVFVSKLLLLLLPSSSSLALSVHSLSTSASASASASSASVQSNFVQSDNNMNPIIQPKEITFQCMDGMTIAGQSWQTTAAASTSTNAFDNVENVLQEVEVEVERILCLHGWMDNCRSFYQLAPKIIHQYQISGKQCHIIAMDFPGHGLSSHKSIDNPPSLLSESVFYVNDLIHQLQWDSNTTGSTSTTDSTISPLYTTTTTTAVTKKIQPFTIIGHSMGTGIACLYAAAFPEHVKKLILLEGVGPLSRNGKDIGLHLRQHIDRRRLGLEIQTQQKKLPRIYESINKAVEARMLTVKTFPGKQYISQQGAYEMVVRGAKSVITTNSSTNTGTSTTSTGNSSGGGVRFIHDVRLQWPSIQYLTQEQVHGLYYTIQCPTCILLGKDGWPYTKESHEHVLNLLKPTVVKTLAGSHHFHLDAGTSQQVATEVIQFLLQ